MKPNFYKEILALFAIFLTFQVASIAQVVTFEPSFATQNDTLTLTFDATKGNGELVGFTGDVYLHTGVITDKSSNPTDWKYTQSTWDSYPQKLKTTSLGDNKWEFKYPSSVREFYDVSAADEVLEVTLLFRGTNDGAGNPDKVGRAAGGGDIFLELFQNEVSAAFFSPTGSSKIISVNEELEIVGLGNSPAGGLNLSLKLNGSEVAQTSVSDTLRYTFSSNQPGNYIFDLIADDGKGEVDSVSFTAIVSDGVVSEARPSGLEDGITYSESGTAVTLSLFAPGKSSVYAIGDFSDWKLDFNYQMKKDSLNPDSVWFWTEIAGLTPGEEYAFQYEVDGSLRIADPYSELVLHPNDRFIPSSVFPDLKAFPTDEATEYVSVLQPGKADYQWEANNYVRPDQENLVIYELLVRDFIEDHSYATLIDTLDYLDRLGINAIELMPVNEFEGNESWGYNPSFHLALDKYYGDPDTFKRFVDEAHKRGIAIILDVVLNHAFGQSPLVRLWNEGNYGKPTSDNPYLNVDAKHPFNVGYDFNHESAATRYFRNRVAKYWIEEYRIDGFRFDLSKGFTQTNNPNNVGAWGNYDQSRVNIWNDYSNYMWSIDPNTYVILEHLSDNSEEIALANLGMMLWGNMNHSYNQASMGYQEDSNFYGVLSESRSFQDKHLIGYMESHDEQWLMFKNISFGNSSGDYNIKNLDTALERQQLVGAFFFTLPGPKMMWQFGEVGYGYGNSGEQCLNDSPICPNFAPGRTANKPIRWDYWNTKGTERIKLYKTWSALINLRNSSSAFTNPDKTNYALSNKIKRIILEHTDTDVVIVGNFDVSAITTTGDFPQLGTWYDFFEGSEYIVNNSEQSITLQPGEFRVFTTKQFDAPDLSVSNEITDLDTPSKFKLYNNYPNPFNPSTNIKFDIAQAGQVQLEVFDVLGRKVASLVNERKSAGNYTVSFDASSLTSGVYFARLTAGNTVQVQKMTLLK